jgi:hypothetical protein
MAAGPQPALDGKLSTARRQREVLGDSEKNKDAKT